jgi:hypothetical protein
LLLLLPPPPPPPPLVVCWQQALTWRRAVPGRCGDCGTDAGGAGPGAEAQHACGRVTAPWGYRVQGVVAPNRAAASRTMRGMVWRAFSVVVGAAPLHARGSSGRADGPLGAGRAGVLDDAAVAARGGGLQEVRGSCPAAGNQGPGPLLRGVRPPVPGGCPTPSRAAPRAEHRAHPRPCPRRATDSCQEVASWRRPGRQLTSEQLLPGGADLAAFWGSAAAGQRWTVVRW